MPENHPLKHGLCDCVRLYVIVKSMQESQLIESSLSLKIDPRAHKTECNRGACSNDVVNNRHEMRRCNGNTTSVDEPVAYRAKGNKHLSLRPFASSCRVFFESSLFQERLDASHERVRVGHKVLQDPLEAAHSSVKQFSQEALFGGSIKLTVVVLKELSKDVDGFHQRQKLFQLRRERVRVRHHGLPGLVRGVLLFTYRVSLVDDIPVDKNELWRTLHELIDDFDVFLETHWRLVRKVSL